LLTGTPGSKPDHYFGQMKVLDSRFFGESVAVFKEFFTNYDHETGAIWSLKKYMKEKFWARVHALTYWKRKDECLDLPEQVDVFEYVELERKWHKKVKELEEEFLTTLNDEEVESYNKLTNVALIRQIVQGHYQGERLHSHKINAVKEMEFDGPVVFFTVWTKDVEDLLAIYPDASVLTGWRDDLQRFKDGETDVLICNYTAGAEGLNLQRASTMVFYSLSWSYDLYDQARARIHRIGQKNKCTYVHLLAQDSIDERVLKALKDKKDFVMEGS